MNIFTVTNYKWLFRNRVAIENNRLIYCVIPSGDKKLAERICELMNIGIAEKAKEKIGGKWLTPQ